MNADEAIGCDLTLFERVLYFNHGKTLPVCRCDLTLFERVLYYLHRFQVLALSCDLTLFERVLYLFLLFLFAF